MKREQPAAEKRQARRTQAVRLLILLCAALTAGFFFFSAAEYLLSAGPISHPLLTASLPAPSPEPLPDRAGDPPLNLNTATYEELLTLPGIGPALAREILQYRESNGPFYFPEDVMDVRGIGSKIFQQLKDRVICEPAP